MEKNKTGKYFKYAIGEIVLVVIGILIALQLNNFNEKRKINNDIESVFSLLENELETNIKESNKFLKYGYEIDSIQTLLNQNKVTRKMIFETPNLINDPFGTRTIKFLDDRLVETITSEKQLPKQYQELIPDIKYVKSLIDEHRFWESKALEFSLRKNEEYVNRFTWFNRIDSLSFERQIHHALTDSIYRNTVNHYTTRLQLNENVWYASLMRSASVALLWQIKTIKELDESYTIKQFFNELGLKPLLEYECSDIPYKTNEINFRRHFIIYNNNTKDSIIINTINASAKRLSSTTIAPKKFLSPKYYFMRPNIFIELALDDECKKVFKHNKGDYLIFE